MTDPSPSGRVDSPALLSVIQAARVLNATPIEVAKLCNDGALDCRWQFARRVVTSDSLRTYVESLPTSRDGAA